jgi:regulator of replication initiation timing
MKDTKSLLLLLVSLLLVLVSFILILTWGYGFFAKNGLTKTNTIPLAIDSTSIANKIKDSLQTVYTATLNDLDTQLDATLTNSDSLKNVLDSKLAEFYRLRSEIAAILASKNANNNFMAARQKIGELQTKVEDLKEKNKTIDVENKKLDAVLKEFGKKETGGEKNTRPGTLENNNNNREQPDAVISAFRAFDMRLSAVTGIGDIETETSVADKTDKLNGAFTVTNFNSQLSNAEMMVVVIGPDGKVLKGSGWDSGTFTTAEGKKIYSYKFNFTYTMGEAKRLAFSLRGNALGKGNYTMEVYHNGLMIGKVIKTLS